MFKKLSQQTLIALSFIFPLLAWAADPGPRLPNPSPGAGNTLEEFVKMLITVIQWVATPLLAVAIIYAGFILVTAGGNEAEITKGKRWITWTLVGAVIVLGAQVIADVVFGTGRAFE